MDKVEDSIIIFDETDGLSNRGHILKELAKRFNVKYVTNSKDFIEWFEKKERKG